MYTIENVPPDQKLFGQLETKWFFRKSYFKDSQRAPFKEMYFSFNFAEHYILV